MTHRPFGGRVLLVVMGLLVGAHVVASGQQAPLQVPGALRSRVTVVPVAVYVTDDRGRPVTDLKESDFTVLEDGVRQSIASFSTQEFRQTTGRQPSVTRAAEAQPPAAASAPPRRTFLIMLGRGRLDEPSHGLRALDAFLRTGLGPDDRVGLMAYTRVTDLTVDREPMLRLLDRYRERYKWVEMQLDNWFNGLVLDYGGSDIPPWIQRDIDAIFDAPGLPRLRDLPMMEAPGEFEFQFASHWVKRAADPFNERESDDESNYIGEMRQDFEALFNAIEYLRPVKGPKHLVYVTENPLPFYYRDTDRLAEVANDAGVSIWPLQTGGNWPISGLHMPRVGSAAFVRPSLAGMLRYLALRAFAEDTGGRASVQQFADKGLAAFESSTRFQYTLGYSPAHAGADGKYHDIKVRVNRKGVVVHHRGGYFARDHFVPTDEREFMANQRLRAAAAYWRNIVDIPIRWEEQGATIQPGGEIAVQATIDPSGIVFENVDGARAASLDIAAFAVDDDGRPIAESRQSLDLKVDEAKLAELKLAGIPWSASLVPAGKAREVRLVVYQFSVDRLGSVVTKVR
jgi:VWFA-related protein